MIPVKKAREEKAIILDYLPHGYPLEGGSMKNPVAQALGTTHLALLELIPKKEVFLQPHQEVYIGDGKREEIHHIKGKIPLSKLTTTAANELTHAVEEVVNMNEEKFVEFFNKAQPLSMRMHQLELLPGVGKKHMWEVIEERKNKPFADFEDLKSRVKLLPNPKQAVIKRILLEIKGEEKHKIFVG